MKVSLQYPPQIIISQTRVPSPHSSEISFASINLINRICAQVQVSLLGRNLSINNSLYFSFFLSGFLLFGQNYEILLDNGLYRFNFFLRLFCYGLWFSFEEVCLYLAALGDGEVSNIVTQYIPAQTTFKLAQFNTNEVNEQLNLRERYINLLC